MDVLSVRFVSNNQNTVPIMKKIYHRPCALQVVEVRLEKASLFSGVDFLNPIETVGHEVDHQYDYEFDTASPFNHEWQD